jgi:hypothetical protein
MTVQNIIASADVVHSALSYILSADKMLAHAYIEIKSQTLIQTKQINMMEIRL